MRKIILVGALALACGTAYAQDSANERIGRAPQAAPATEAAPAPQAAPAPKTAPAPQAAAPEAGTSPAAKPAKPVKKQQARRRETDEEKARRIAAKYGVSW
jgi:pyruvate/2-oxoglutarate dehydrogenase complex dihydrolipoamide acyltransferase (E2) component